MQHTVDSGLVQGTTLATTPKGLANLRIPFSRIVLDQVAGPRALLVAHGPLGLVLDLVELVLEDTDAGLVHREARQRLGRLGL